MARVVRIPNATHGVYITNEADVLREIELFIGKLPPVDDAKLNQEPVSTTQSYTRDDAQLAPAEGAPHP
jgi:hypothetical protein